MSDGLPMHAGRLALCADQAVAMNVNGFEALKLTPVERHAIERERGPFVPRLVAP